MNKDLNRTKTLSTDEQASLRGFFHFPLLYLQHMEHAHLPEDRRSLYRDDPPWLLLFKNSYYAKARDFVHMTVCTLIALENSPAIAYESFHLETGVVTKHLVEYLRSIDDADKVFSFITRFRSYLTGERKRMPRNISDDREAYESLKSLVRTDYTQRLIGEYKGGNDNATQDFVVLFKMPLFALLETVFCSITDEDIVQAIEPYRA